MHIELQQKQEIKNMWIISLYRMYTGPEVIKLFSCSTQLTMKFFMLINVKMPTIVSILTCISMINTISDRNEAKNIFVYRYCSFYEQQLNFCAQPSRA